MVDLLPCSGCRLPQGRWGVRTRQGTSPVLLTAQPDTLRFQALPAHGSVGRSGRHAPDRTLPTLAARCPATLPDGSARYLARIRDAVAGRAQHSTKPGPWRITCASCCSAVMAAWGRAAACGCFSTYHFLNGLARRCSSRHSLTTLI